MDEAAKVNWGEASEGVGVGRKVPVFGCEVCGLRFRLMSVCFEHLEESGHGGKWLKRYRDE